MRSHGKRWSRSEGVKAVARWRRSGMSLGEFCQRRGVARHRLSYWRGVVESPTAQQTGFVEVRHEEKAPLEVCLGVVRITVGGNFDRALLRSVVEALS